MRELQPTYDHAAYPVQRSPLMGVLRTLTRLLPNDHLRTWVYLNLVDAPRRALRQALHTFYRIDHVYDVLREFGERYNGRFSILEFGTSDGYAFTKMLFATRYLGMANRVTVHGFDTFAGMPPAADAADLDLVGSDSWVEGQFCGRYDELQRHCAGTYENFRLHKGLFEHSLTDQFLGTLRQELPILIWIDCDYYSSARSVFERLLPYLPNGCVIYFDDLDNLNFGSRFTGEARLVHEVNHGCFGDDVELIADTKLSLDSKRIYRFVRFNGAINYTARKGENDVNLVHRRTNDSPLP